MRSLTGERHRGSPAGSGIETLLAELERLRRNTEKLVRLEWSRRRAIQALKRSKEQYGRIMDSIAEAALVVQRGRVVFSNLKAERHLALPAVGQGAGNFVDLVHRDDREIVRERQRRALCGHGDEVAGTLRVRGADGGMRTMRLSSIRIAWDGEPATLNLLHDLSAEEPPCGEPVAGRRLEATGGGLGGMVHDLNNLLTTIRGHCDLMLLSLDTDEPLREPIGRIRAAGERASGLTRQLLASAQGDPGARQGFAAAMSSGQSGALSRPQNPGYPNPGTVFGPGTRGRLPPE